MTQTTEHSFFNYSKEIAQSFLQTVVAVDDKLFFEEPAISEADSNIDEPDEDSGLGISNETLSPARASSHDLNYQSLSTAFAQKGIVCGGFRPLGDPDDSLNAIVQTSKNADITILDWQMDEQNPGGTLATNAINELAKSDIDEGGRLRLIIVYTAETIQDVTELLCTSLKGSFSPKQSNETVTFTDKGLSHWKINVISKDKDIEDLPSIIINSFTQLTAGLLSNAALSTIADVRDKTHNILHKFNKSLDPAYLSHVLGLISSPDMREQAHEVAFDYAIDLFSEELKSELQTSENIKSSLTKEIMQSWPEHTNSKNNQHFFRLKIGSDKPIKFDTTKMKKLLSEPNSEQLKEILENDFQIQEKDKTSPIDRFKKEVIQLTVGNDNTAPLFDLCAIESARKDISTVRSHIPTLKQGTVLMRQNTKEYFVCVQPLCDSIRLKGLTSFSLIKISNAKKQFTHVLINEGGHLKLKISPTPKEIRIYLFKPDVTTSVVKAKKHDGKLIFEAKTESNEDYFTLEWCGEFKQAVSQAIVNSLAAQLSRVGLDTFEWLRLKRPT